MAGNIPEIGVRLSASGVQDVVAAFQRVRMEGKNAAQDTAKGFQLLNTQLQSLTALVPLVTFGVMVQKLVASSAAARENAENIGKLSEKTGAAVGTLSALSLAAHDSEVEQEAFGAALVKLARNMQDASTGAAKPKKAFTDLGITLADLKSKDPGQIFALVAAKLAALPDGAHKAQIAIALFGKTGAELLPMLKSLGTDGLDAATEKAKRLGLYLSEDMIRDARAAQDALHDLEDMAAGLATRFNAGFMPRATTGIEMLAEALTGSGVDAMKTFGDYAGKLFEFFIAGLVTIELNFERFWARFKANTEYAAGAIQALGSGLTNGGIAGAVNSYRAYQPAAEQSRANATDFAEKKYDNAVTSMRDAYYAAPKPSRAGGTQPGGGADGDGMDDAQREKLAQAYSAYLQSKADNQLAIQRLTNQIAEAEDKRRYDAGLITVDEYYDRVEARAAAEAKAEITTLQQKLAAANKLPDGNPEQRYKKLSEVGKIETAITEVQLKGTAAATAAEQDRTKAKHDNALKELEDQEKLQKLSGDIYGAEQTALQVEIQQYKELLDKRKDLTDEQKNALTNDYEIRGQAKIGFGQNNAEAGRIMDGMSSQIGSIQDQAANGSITEVAAQAQILDLETKQLAILQPLLEVMKEQALASKDPAVLATWNQLNASVARVAASMKNVTTAQTYLTNQLATSGRSSVEDFFTSIGDGTKSASASFDDLAADFEQMVSRMVSKLLIYYALESLVGWIAPTAGAGFLKTLTAAGPFGKYDSGGWTGGRAGNVAGIVHGEEFVVKAGPAAQYRGLLEDINSGRHQAAVRSVASTQSISSDYAASMANPGDGGGDSPLVQVITPPGATVQQKQVSGAGGKSIQQIIISTVQQDMASGGAVAKQMETNYGLARGGTRRG